MVMRNLCVRYKQTIFILNIVLSVLVDLLSKEVQKGLSWG